MKFLKRSLPFLVISLLVYPMLSFSFTGSAGSIIPGDVGNYIGFQMGGTKIHAEDEILPDDDGNLQLVRPSGNGFGFRLYWGYDFTANLGIEGGYAFYSPATYNIPNGHSPQLRIQTLDLMGKGGLPLFWGLSAFIKGGVALVFYKQGGLLVPNPQPGGEDGSSGVTARPEVGIGMAYRFAPNWSVDLNATRITKGGIVPNSDMYSIGITYHAVDLYCGQFLC